MQLKFFAIFLFLLIAVSPALADWRLKNHALVDVPNTDLNRTSATPPVWINGSCFGGSSCYNFTASQSQFLQSGNSTIYQNLTNMTVALRVNLSTNITGYAFAGGPNTDQIFYCVLHSTSNFRSNYRNSTAGAVERTNGAAPRTSVWNNFTCVFSPASNVMYRNGTNVSSAAGLNKVASVNMRELNVGWQPTGNYWNGRIDDIRIWNRTLTQAEITAYNNGNTSVACSNLIVWYPFEYDQQNCTSAPAANSCTYSGSGDWTIQGSDNCVITNTTSVGGNRVFVVGSGSLTLSGSGARIANATLIRLYNSVVFTLTGGARLG